MSASNTELCKNTKQTATNSIIGQYYIECEVKLSENNPKGGKKKGAKGKEKKKKRNRKKKEKKKKRVDEKKGQKKEKKGKKEK